MNKEDEEKYIFEKLILAVITGYYSGQKHAKEGIEGFTTKDIKPILDLIGLHFTEQQIQEVLETIKNSKQTAIPIGNISK